MRLLVRLSLLVLLCSATATHALGKVSLLTNWFAEAEHGGFCLAAMTRERWKQAFAFMAKVGLVKAGMDVRKAHTLEFVRQIQVLP